MRIKITFNNDAETYLPINTNFYLSRLIHELSTGYSKYLRSLTSGHRRSQAFDMFTFSQLIIPYRQILGWEIGILSDEFYWYIASPYPQFLGIIAMRLRELKKARIYKHMFGVERVEFMADPRFNESQAHFTCLSPVAVQRNKALGSNAGSADDSNYIFPFEEDYVAFLENDILEKHNRLQDEKRDELHFSLEFDQEYIRKRKNKIIKVIRLENGNKQANKVKGVLAPLQIEADPDILSLIYNTGLGHYNSMGFGMVERIS